MQPFAASHAAAASPLLATAGSSSLDSDSDRARHAVEADEVDPIIDRGPTSVGHTARAAPSAQRTATTASFSAEVIFAVVPAAVFSRQSSIGRSRNAHCSPPRSACS